MKLSNEVIWISFSHSPVIQLSHPLKVSKSPSFTSSKKEIIWVGLVYPPVLIPRTSLVASFHGGDPYFLRYFRSSIGGILVSIRVQEWECKTNGHLCYRRRLKSFSSKVLNAIDGRPTEICVHVDWEAFKTTFSVNWCGLSKNQLKLLGAMWANKRFIRFFYPRMNELTNELTSSLSPASWTPQHTWAYRTYGQCDYSLFNISLYSEWLTIASQNAESKSDKV